MALSKITDPDVIRQLETGPQKITDDPAIIAQLEAQGGERGAVEQGVFDLGAGFNTGAVNMVSLPADALQGLLGKIGIDAPIGSENLKQVLGQLGVEFEGSGGFVERVGEELGASAIPLGAAGTAAKAGIESTVPVVREVLEAATKTPGAFAGTELAAATGSGVGAATAQEIAPDSVGAELTGQILGGAGPTVVSGLVRGAIRGGDAGREAIEKTVGNFEAAGVTPSVGQATDNRAFQALETLLSKLPGGGGPIVRAAQRTAENIGKKIDEIASSISARSGAEEAGRAIKRGILGETGFIARFSQKADELFTRVDEFVPTDKAVSVRNARDKLAELSAPIEGAENLSGILSNPKIQQIRGALDADAGNAIELPYTALKQLRSQVGRLLASSEIIAEAPRAQLKQLYGALTEDMRQAATDAGSGALAAFTRANNHYKAGINRVDNFLQRISGKANPEDVFRAATQGREGATTIRAVRRSLKPEEWSVVASSVLKRLGKATPGAQDDLGEVFSVETFLTNWNRLPKESRDALFGGGGQLTKYAKDLDAIASAASTIREGSRVLANPSGTAAQGANIAALAAGVTGAATGNPLIATTLAGGALTANVSARLMTSPAFVRWLARGTEISVERLPGHIARLSQTAANVDAETQEAISSFIGLLASTESQPSQSTSTAQE